MGSHLSPLFSPQQSRMSAGVVHRDLLGRGVPKGQMSWGHKFTPEFSALFPSLLLFPLPLFLPSAALSHPLLSCSAGDARAPGESQQPGRGPGLRVPRRQRELDGAAGFPPLLHRILRGARKRLEVPLQGLHQWRRYSIIPWSSHISPSLSWAGGMCL